MAEVDFVIEKNGNIIPIEIKSNLNHPSFTKSFLSFLEKYKPKRSFILSERLFAKRKNTKFRPIFYIGEEL